MARAVLWLAAVLAVLAVRVHAAPNPRAVELHNLQVLQKLMKAVRCARPPKGGAAVCRLKF